MTAMEINKIVASILVAGLVFMAISVGVDEIWHEEALEEPVYPVPETAEATAEAEPAEEEEEAPIAVRLADADPAAGEKVGRKCGACHSFDKGGPNKVGPNLYGAVGADIAADPDFSYSDALAGLDGGWDYEKLDAFLANPREFAPGTKMTFAGVRDPQDRADLIAYLRQQADAPPPLPGE